MKRLALIVVSIALLATTGCGARSSSVVASGRVTDEVVDVAAPALPTAVPDVEAGTRTGAQAPQRRASSVATLTALGQRVRVTDVRVEVGDRVKTGQVVAVLSRAALRASLAAAQTDRRAARNQVRVLDQRLDDLAEARATIASTRSDVTGAIGQLTGTRAELVSRLGQARTQLAELRALQKRLANLPKLPPGGLPPGGVPPTGAPRPPTPRPPANLPDPAQVAGAIAQLEAGIAQLQGAIAQIDAGLGTARGGLIRLENASADLADAKTALTDARSVARIVADGTSVAVDLAEAQLALATLRSPTDGVVVEALQAGEVVAPGAPVVTIRADAPSAVDVWISPDQARRIAQGDEALVRVDSLAGRDFAATVTTIGSRAIYPPNFLATQDVHLTRAVPVRVTLDDESAALPPGTPADVEIRPRR